MELDTTEMRNRPFASPQKFHSGCANLPAAGIYLLTPILERLVLSLNLPEHVTLIEVGPRDGLQNEKNEIPTEIKIEFIKSLKNAGFKEMELTSFVSPKWVPQLKDAEEIIRYCTDEHRNIVLTPNEKGVELAKEAKCDSVAFFVGVSESFNLKNINRTTKESMASLLPVIRQLKAEQFFVRACISTSFYCPYEGRIHPDDVLTICQQFADAGVDDLSVADRCLQPVNWRSLSGISVAKQMGGSSFLWCPAPPPTPLARTAPPVKAKSAFSVGTLSVCLR